MPSCMLTGCDTFGNKGTHTGMSHIIHVFTVQSIVFGGSLPSMYHVGYYHQAQYLQLAQFIFMGGCPPPYIPNILPTLNAHYQWPIFGSKLPGDCVPVPRTNSCFFS